MNGTTTKVVSVPKTVKSKELNNQNTIDYTTHPKYMEVSCNTKLDNIGKDMTLMMLEDTINEDGHITNESLFISKLDTMVKRGKRPPSSTKGGKEDYSEEMIVLESQVNRLIKGKKFVNKKGHDIKPMFYFRDDTKLKQNKDKKKNS